MVRALCLKALPAITAPAARADAVATVAIATLIMRKNIFSLSLCAEVSRRRFELLTLWFGTIRSILLSYWDVAGAFQGGRITSLAQGKDDLASWRTPGLHGTPKAWYRRQP